MPSPKMSELKSHIETKIHNLKIKLWVVKHHAFNELHVQSIEQEINRFERMKRYLEELESKVSDNPGTKF